MTPFSYTISVDKSGQIHISKIEKRYPMYYGLRHVDFGSLDDFEEHFKKSFDAYGYEFQLRRALVAWAFEKMSAYSVCVYGNGDISIKAPVKGGDGFGPSTGIGG